MSDLFLFVNSVKFPLLCVSYVT